MRSNDFKKFVEINFLILFGKIWISHSKILKTNKIFFQYDRLIGYKYKEFSQQIFLTYKSCKDWMPLMVWYIKNIK